MARSGRVSWYVAIDLTTLVLEAKIALAGARADERRSISAGDRERALVAEWEERRRSAERSGQVAEARNALALRCEHEAHAKAAEDAYVRDHAVAMERAAALEVASSRLETSQREAAIAAAREASAAATRGCAKARARFDRALVRARRVGTNAAGSAEDLSKALTMLVLAMNNALVEAKKHVASMIATEKRLAAQAGAARAHEAEWRKRMAKADASGITDLEREAAARASAHSASAEALLAEWAAQKDVVDALKRGLRGLNDEIEAAQRDRAALVARKGHDEAFRLLRQAATALAIPASHELEARHALEAATAALASSVAQATEHRGRERTHDGHALEWERRARMALAAGNPELAAEAIGRQREHEAHATLYRQLLGEWRERRYALLAELEGLPAGVDPELVEAMKRSLEGA